MSTRERFTELEKLIAKSAFVLEADIDRAGDIMTDCINRGGKILVCGNGGSAALAQHLAAELVGRFEIERKGYAAIALTADSAVLTAAANDYAYSQVFARQVAALGRAGDVLVAISTSGTSANVMAAIQEADRLEMQVILLTGEGYEVPLTQDALPIRVPSPYTAEIQEVHQLVVHCLCARVEMLLEGSLG